MTGFPTAILFCCDHNAVRSPMAEGLMKQLYGKNSYVQSAGVRNDMDIDGFSIAVCHEIGVELDRHRARSFEDMRDWGEEISGFDLIIALSPASHEVAQRLATAHPVDVEYWPIQDPTARGEDRDTKLDAYRQTRDQIRSRILARFGEPQSR